MTFLLFFRGAGIVDELVREIEHGDFAHVACRVSATEVIEAVEPKVLLRPYEPEGRDKDAVEVPHALNVPWLWLQVGKDYDETALVCDLISEHLPGGIEIYDSKQGAWDCSRLAAVAAGLNTLGETGPVTPQRLYEIVTRRTQP